MPRNIIYILPLNTKVLSGEWGWEFSSTNYISGSLINKIVAILEIGFVEKYLDVEKYANQHVDMNVVFENGTVNEVCIRTRLSINEIMSKIDILLRSFDVDVFMPPDDF